MPLGTAKILERVSQGPAKKTGPAVPERGVQRSQHVGMRLCVLRTSPWHVTAGHRLNLLLLLPPRAQIRWEAWS